MDVHKDSITVAVLPGYAPAPSRVDKLSSDYPRLKRYLDRVAGDGDLVCCYEASGAGYVLQRAIKEWGYQCEVIAPSLIPRRPGVQRKYDKRDAADLARLYRAGELTPVRIPSDAEERVRDIVRLRDTLQRELMKSRHYILKFLTRRGFVFREGTHWTGRHLTWLRKLAGADSPLTSEDRFVVSEYVALMEYKLQRRDELDRRIAELAVLPFLAPSVNHLQSFRGIALQGAMVLSTEIVDWRRFATAGQLASYLGLVSRENSTGSRERRGSITKAGNSHCRHVLIQAAWSYRHKPHVSRELATRQQGMDASVIAHSWKAQHRLYKRFHHLAFRKSSQIAAVAVARELVGFLWSVMKEMPASSATSSLEQQQAA
jgi:transposase